MWRVRFRAEVEEDVRRACDWYHGKQEGLGADFIDEVIRVFDCLAENPFLNSRKHPTKDIRWRFPDRFPYRVIYQINADEQTILVLAVIHAARNDSRWRKRVT